MEPKKISFGFMKSKKVEKPVVAEKREYIECVEEKAIKVVGGEEVKEEAPLVIPMKPNTLITTDRMQQIAEEVESSVLEPYNKEEPKSPIQTETVQPENETLDQIAVRELLQEAKKEVKTKLDELVLPVPTLPGVEGQKESSLEDYNSVPIEQFGLAMLRGMGWKPGAEQKKQKEPQLRPKGLGLGADKMVNKNQKKPTNKNEEELMIVKNAFVKITTGKYNGCYAKVLSLDEDNGRVMVDITVRKETVSLSEFMMHPVTKAEYDRESRVINTDSYEEYKRKEQQGSKNSSPRRDRDESSKSNESRRERNRDKIDSSRDRHSNSIPGRNGRHQRDSSSSEERSKRDRSTERHMSRRDRSKERNRRDKSNNRSRRREKSEERRREKRVESSDSLSSSSESDRKRRDSSSDSEEESRKKSRKSKKSKKEDKKRDIDKKRKGKKKRRDRDRSPNYKKHRK